MREENKSILDYSIRDLLDLCPFENKDIYIGPDFISKSSTRIEFFGDIGNERIGFQRVIDSKIPIKIELKNISIAMHDMLKTYADKE